MCCDQRKSRSKAEWSAAVRGQLRVLDERVRRKREIFESYRNLLGDLLGIDFMPEASWGRATRWPACA